MAWFQKLAQVGDISPALIPNHVYVFSISALHIVSNLVA